MADREIIAPVTLRAYGQGERLRLWLPRSWHPWALRLEPYTQYGPLFRGPVVFWLQQAHHRLRQGYRDLAYTALCAAEQSALGLEVPSCSQS